MQHLRVLVIAVLAALVPAAACAQSQVEVSREGRPIQLDGFLPEWKAENAAHFAGSGQLLWDLAGTKEGLAGYVRSTTVDSCRPAQVRIYPNFSALHRWWTIDLGPDTVGQWLSRTVTGTGPVVAEFLVPWDSLHVDSSGAYGLAAAAFGSCGDTIGLVIVKGVRRVTVGSVMSRRLVVQFGVIAVLFAVYLLLMLRVRRKTRQTGSPRQSA